MNIKKTNLGSLSLCALVVAGAAVSFATPAQAATNSCPAIPTSMSCSNLPTFPKSISCSNLPAAPVIPACPAAPKQVDFATAIASNAMSAYANEYSIKWGRMPASGEAGYQNGSQVVHVGYSRHMETDPSGLHSVHQWDLSQFPANNTAITESIVYLEYPNAPRDPAVQDILLNHLNPLMSTISSATNNRARQLLIGCKTKAALFRTPSSGSSIQTYTYLMSNNPSATYMVYGTSGTLPAQNCTLRAIFDHDYNPSSDGTTPAHSGPN